MSKPMSPENAAKEFNLIRSIFMANQVGDALDRSAQLRSEFHYDSDPILGVRIDLWHAIYLAMHGKTTEALTVLHVPMATANSSLKDQVFADQECCFDLVYGYFMYAHTVITSGKLHVSVLSDVLDEAEKICVSTNNPGWMTTVHCGRAKLYVKLDRPDDAIREIELALKTAELPNQMLEKSGVVRDMATLYSDLDRNDLAEPLLLQGQDAKRPVDRMYYIMRLGRIRLKENAFEEAVVFADRLHELADQITVRQACGIWGFQTEAYLGVGDIDRAAAAAAKMRQAATILCTPEIDICAYFDEIDVHIARREFPEAKEKIELAQVLADKLDGATSIRHQNNELELRRKNYLEKLNES